MREMYSVGIQKVRSLNLRCKFPPVTLGRGPSWLFQLLGAPVSSWFSLFAAVSPQPLRVFVQPSFVCVSLCVHWSLVLGSTVIQYDLLLTNYTCREHISYKVPCEVLGGHEFEGTLLFIVVV